MIRNLFLLLYICEISCQDAFYTNMTILQLDNKLVEMLKNPKEGEGNIVLKGSLHYLEELEEMNTQCIREDPRKSLLTWMQSSLVKGIDKVENYLKTGEPKFINIKLNRSALREKYRWTDTELIKFETYTLSIKILLKKFKEYIDEHNNKY